MLVIQADPFNESRIPTAIVAVITSNLRLADAPGNVRASRAETGLPRHSVVNVSQAAMAQVDNGLRLVLGL